MQTNEPIDPTAVWAKGKAEPGWYMARGIWSQKYAEHLASLGYEVQRSTRKPTDEEKQDQSLPQEAAP